MGSALSIEANLPQPALSAANAEAKTDLTIELYLYFCIFANLMAISEVSCDNRGYFIGVVENDNRFQGSELSIVAGCGDTEFCREP
jgi:hypothetical protein